MTRAEEPPRPVARSPWLYGGAIGVAAAAAAAAMVAVIVLLVQTHGVDLIDGLPLVLLPWAAALTVTVIGWRRIRQRRSLSAARASSVIGLVIVGLVAVVTALFARLPVLLTGFSCGFGADCAETTVSHTQLFAAAMSALIVLTTAATAVVLSRAGVQPVLLIVPAAMMFATAGVAELLARVLSTV